MTITSEPAGTAAAAPLMVRVVNRGNGPGYQYPVIERFAISALCGCGQPRGTPYEHRFAEDGDWLTCDRWDNPCGHVDTYEQLLAQRAAVLDANGAPVRLPAQVVADDAVKAFMAGRVPAAQCPHYLAASEAAAGFTRCEHCP